MADRTQAQRLGLQPRPRATFGAGSRLCPRGAESCEHNDAAALVHRRTQEAASCGDGFFAVFRCASHSWKCSR